jgi:pimeloyl-ACP methyl ester carboxylesterase
MDAPGRLHWCTTADGVRLAWASGGAGDPPIVKTANWLSHLEEEPRVFASRHWVAELSRRNRLVRYDARGCGLSDRQVERVSLDAWVDDLEAVVEAAGVGRFVLFGVSQGSAVAVRYAARHPDRVAGLILYGAFARGMLRQGHGPKIDAAAQALMRLAELGWGADTGAFRRVFTSNIFPGADDALLQAFDDNHRHTVSGEMVVRYMRTFFDIDVRDDAVGVRCPALVMHTRDERMILASEGRLLASLIPDARFVDVPGVNHLPLETDAAWTVLRDEMRAFLERLRTPQDAPPRLTARQLEVLRHVARGLTDKQTARELALSPRTVEMHVAAVLRALGSPNRADAVRRAIAWRLLD